MLNVAGAARPALADDSRADLARYKWRIYRGTVFRHGDKRLFLAHVIAGKPPAGFGCVHQNGDRMDFRRDNLIFEPLKQYSARAGASRRARRLKREGQRELSFG
jgi:hypothetical protein